MSHPGRNWAEAASRYDYDVPFYVPTVQTLIEAAVFIQAGYVDSCNLSGMVSKNTSRGWGCCHCANRYWSASW